MHRDLKPRNIMLHFPDFAEVRSDRKIFKSQLTDWHFKNLQEAGCLIKIIDFGHSKQITDESLMFSMNRGNLMTNPPE